MIHRLLVFALFFEIGCATIFTGSHDIVNINSDPDHAKVYVEGLYTGNTPTIANLKRDKDYEIILIKEGYQKTRAHITRSFNMVAILNFIDVIGWVIDFATGALWKFDTTGLMVTLSPEEDTKK